VKDAYFTLFEAVSALEVCSFPLLFFACFWELGSEICVDHGSEDG